MFQNQAKMRLDLKGTIRFAKERAPIFDSLGQNLAIATLEEESALRRLLPSLDLSTTHGLRDTEPRTVTLSSSTQANPPWVSELVIELTQNLYDNGVTFNNYEIARLKKSRADHLFQVAKNKLCLDLAVDFIKFSLHSKLLEIQKSQTKARDRQFAMISNLFQQGLRVKRDYLRLQTRVRRGQIDLQKARTTVENDRLNLAGQIGVADNDVSAVEFVPFPIEETALLVSSKPIEIQDHFEYRAMDREELIGALEVKQAKAKYGVELYLSAGIGYQNSDYLGNGPNFSDNDYLSWNGMLVFKYNLWDWGIRRRDYEVAYNKNLVRDNELKEKRQKLSTQIRQLRQTINELKQNLDLTRELLNLEQSNLKVVEHDYRNGKAGYYELVTSLDDYAEAEIKYSTAVTDWQIATLNELYHQGSLYDYLTQ